MTPVTLTVSGTVSISYRLRRLGGVALTASAVACAFAVMTAGPSADPASVDPRIVASGSVAGTPAGSSPEADDPQDDWPWRGQLADLANSGLDPALADDPGGDDDWPWRKVSAGRL